MAAGSAGAAPTPDVDAAGWRACWRDSGSLIGAESTPGLHRRAPRWGDSGGRGRCRWGAGRASTAAPMARCVLLWLRCWRAWSSRPSSSSRRATPPTGPSARSRALSRFAIDGAFGMPRPENPLPNNVLLWPREVQANWDLFEHHGGWGNSERLTLGDGADTQASAVRRPKVIHLPSRGRQPRIR